MFLKRPVELPSIDTSSPAKCLKVTDAEMHEEGGSEAPARAAEDEPVGAGNKGDAEELLKGTLARLLVWKGEADFPLKCLSAVREEIVPLLDGPYNTRDTLLLRAETGAGRNLAMVLLLGAAVVTSGFSALIADRTVFDDSRVASTRSWIAWARQARKTSIFLTNLSTARWSSIKQAFEEQPEDPIAELDAAIVECFQNHPDAISIATLEDEDITCECCDIAYVRCRLAFYNCPACDIDLCAQCEERRVNFK
jgi:hypothetical protein